MDILPRLYVNAGIRSLYFPKLELSLYYAIHSEIENRNKENRTEMLKRYYLSKTKNKQFEEWYDKIQEGLTEENNTEEDIITYISTIHNLPIRLIEFVYDDHEYSSLVRKPKSYRIIYEVNVNRVEGSVINDEILTLLRVNEYDWSPTLNKEAIIKTLEKLDINPEDHKEKIEKLRGNVYYFPIKHEITFKSKFKLIK